MKLTAKTVAELTLPVGKTDVIHFDAELAGFGFRLRRGAGAKILRSWVAQYKVSGKTRRLLLGSAAVLGAEQARAAAKKVLAKVTLGEDPARAQHDRRSKDLLTMRAQVGEFLAAKELKLRARTMVEHRRYLTDPRYFGPLHRKPLDQISRKDIGACLVAITRTCGSPTASRARGALGSFFSWAMTMGLCEANPTIGAVQPAGSTPRDRVLSDDELVRIWRACRDDDHGRIIRLLVLTACRRAEIGDMTWDEIDPDRGTFTIAAPRSKNGRPHTLPLPRTAIEILRQVPRMATRLQLFGQRSHGFTRWHKGKLELDQRSGVEGWTYHDLRRTTATRLADLGVQPHVIECILNHSGGFRGGVAATYIRSPYANEMRAALIMWADHTRTLVEGGERKVVAFERRESAT
jgi:integrase